MWLFYEVELRVFFVVVFCCCFAFCCQMLERKKKDLFELRISEILGSFLEAIVSEPLVKQSITAEIHWTRKSACFPQPASRKIQEGTSYSINPSETYSSDLIPASCSFLLCLILLHICYQTLNSSMS